MISTTFNIGSYSQHKRHTYIAQKLLRLNPLALEVLTKDTLVRKLRLQLVRVLLQNQRSAPLLS